MTEAKLPTAREAAHECIAGIDGAACFAAAAGNDAWKARPIAHGDLCDAITAAIESRDVALRSAVAEEMARIADEWARDGATEYSQMTGRSIAGRIRSTRTPKGDRE